MNSLNLKQVKGNFQRLFDKNLTDLVRGLRNNKDNEVNEVSSARFSLFSHREIIHISTFLISSFSPDLPGELHCTVHRRD